MTDAREDLAMLAMECASDTIAACRLEAAQVRQTGLFENYRRFLEDNAKAAEKWLLKAGRAYPHQCDAQGKPIPQERT